MEKSIIFTIIIILILLLSCKKTPKKEEVENIGKTHFYPYIGHYVDKMLGLTDCYATRILAGDHSPSYHDKKDSTSIFLRPNGIGQDYKDTTDACFDEYNNYFVYAYFDSTSTNLNICFKNFGSSGGWFDTFSCDWNSNTCRFERRSEYNGEKMKCSVDKTMVLFDKKSYKNGDRIKGYVMYQLVSKNYNDWFRKEKIYFSCLIGTSPNPLENLNNLEECDAAPFNKDFRDWLYWHPMKPEHLYNR